MEWLQEERPELVARYQTLYRRGAYMPVAERRELTRLIEGPLVPPRERFTRVMKAQPDPPKPIPRFEPQPVQGRLF
jgi:hypothetical protein